MNKTKRMLAPRAVAKAMATCDQLVGQKIIINIEIIIINDNFLHSLKT